MKVERDEDGIWIAYQYEDPAKVKVARRQLGVGIEQQSWASRGLTLDENFLSLCVQRIRTSYSCADSSFVAASSGATP